MTDSRKNPYTTCCMPDCGKPLPVGALYFCIEHRRESEERDRLIRRNIAIKRGELDEALICTEPGCGQPGAGDTGYFCVDHLQFRVHEPEQKRTAA